MQRVGKSLAFAAIVSGGVLLCAWLTVTKLAVLSVSEVFEVTPAPLPPATDAAAAVARGRHLAHAVLGCTSCHGPDLAGRILMDRPWVARVVAANLTTPARDEATWVRAIRHGVRADGRGLWTMPNLAYRDLADDDLAAVVAYGRTLTPVARPLPPQRLWLGGRIQVALGRWHLVTATASRTAPAAAPVPATAAHGRYLFTVARCATCHAAAAVAPAAAAPGALARALRTGRDAAGAAVPGHEPAATGWADLDAAELAGLAAYLATEAR